MDVLSQTPARKLAWLASGASSMPPRTPSWPLDSANTLPWWAAWERSSSRQTSFHGSDASAGCADVGWAGVLGDVSNGCTRDSLYSSGGNVDRLGGGGAGGFSYINEQNVTDVKLPVSFCVKPVLRNALQATGSLSRVEDTLNKRR